MARSDRDQRGRKPWSVRAGMLRWLRTQHNRTDRHGARQALRKGDEPEPRPHRHQAEWWLW